MDSTIIRWWCHREKSLSWGDNRNDSTDSRFAVLSFVDEKYIMGRVLLRLYPLNKIGTVN